MLNTNIKKGDTLKVLLVEDSSLSCTITKYMLQSLDCQVITAANGKKALDIYRLQQDSIDLILLDIEMPIMDGHMLLNALRKEFKNALCFVCAFSTLINIENVNQFGFDDFISKPTSTAELLQLINNVRYLKSQLIKK